MKTWILVNPNGEDWWEAHGVKLVEIESEDLELLKTGGLPGDVKPLVAVSVRQLGRFVREAHSVLYPGDDTEAPFTDSMASDVSECLTPALREWGSREP
jgi:hypothetical protein